MGRLRIISGSLRGRRIRVPPGPLVRPTPDRVREALFNILTPRVAGARVLDAFGGSGALGLEAISRGARDVVFLETDPGVAGVLGANIDDLGVSERCHVLVADAAQALRTRAVRGPFDLILADPPYRADLARSFLAAAAESRALAGDGLLVLEGEATPGFDPREVGGGLQHVREARYGRTRIDFYRHPAPT